MNFTNKTHNGQEVVFPRLIESPPTLALHPFFPAGCWYPPSLRCSSSALTLPLWGGWCSLILWYQAPWSPTPHDDFPGCLNWVSDLLCPSELEPHSYVDLSRSIACSYNCNHPNHYNRYVALYFLKFFQEHFLIWTSSEKGGFILLFLMWTRRD